MEAIAPEELVRLCQKGLPEDTRAFETLVSMYKDRVFSTAYRLMGNRQDAEDQAQEAFLKIYRGIRQLDDPSTLTSWVYRVTTNTCFDALSRQKRRPQTIPLAPPGDDGAEEPRYADTRLPGPEQAALRREVWDCLEKTLAELDPTGRAALILRDIEDRPYQEIAEIMAVGLSAAKMRIHRARLAFQHALEQICPGLRQASGRVG
ncbi:RNA polymerase sigma factor [Kouleothrix sp.]|uniref:RNA polymerase sigma factor n=1 Tax=Kouleothrix sp. TaxID=2779161 RepID=UPI00391CEFEE